MGEGDAAPFQNPDDERRREQSPPLVPHLLDLIKSEKNPVAALAHLETLAAAHPAFTPSSALLFALLRRVAAAAPPHLPRLLSFLRSRPRHLRPRFSEAAALVALKAFSCALMPDEAIAAFRALPAAFRCRPSARSLNVLLDALVRARRWDQAGAFFAFFSSPASRAAPNLQSYNILLRALCEQNQYNRANDLLIVVFSRIALLTAL